jgi:ABC-type branched-subunit amino acid transport system permease subunit
VVGTFVFLGIPEFLRIESLYRLIVLGVVIVLVVLLMPQGIVGLANRLLKRWQRTTPAAAPAEAGA